jgi:hypothetical protein
MTKTILILGAGGIGGAAALKPLPSTLLMRWRSLR